ncbi:MAG: serine/threonine protein kinase, partial [Planctomycetota bacterium]
MRIHGVEETDLDGQPTHFLVMEYVEGQTLRALQEELSVVPEELCRHIAREVAKGLGAVHDAGVIHRDLKPENILITRDHVVKVMDLGMARPLGDMTRLSEPGAFVGSVQYAAPEQFRAGGSEVDARADLYALGRVLYELATGRVLFRSLDVAAIVDRVLSEKPRPAGALNPQLSPFFEEAVHCLLEKEREARFPSAAELLQILEEGEDSRWWRERATSIRAVTRKPLRRIRVRRETALYGRESEIQELEALFERTRTGEGQVVLIEGEAGIGKTRLVDEFVAGLSERGEDVNFLFGSYPPAGAATAAGAFSTAFREHFGGETLDEILGRYVTETSVLIPAFAALLRGEPAPEGTEPLTRDSIHAVFLQSARTLSTERPTIVLIDDLHYAPDEGRSLFAALSIALAGHRVLLVGTARHGVPESWLAELERLENATRIGLSRLGPKDLTRLLIEAFGSERLAEELGFKLAVKSDGNPFFVFEIIRSLRDHSLISQTPEGSWVITDRVQNIELPSTVLDLIQLRLSALEREERELLDVAACCGFEFDATLVAEAVEENRIPAIRIFAHMERVHRLVRSAGRGFVFDHDQIRGALYESLPEVLREAYHAALGEALEARVGTSPDQVEGKVAVDLCQHFLRGGRGARAVVYLLRALEHLQNGHLNGPLVELADDAL